MNAEKKIVIEHDKIIRAIDCTINFLTQMKEIFGGQENVQPRIPKVEVVERPRKKLPMMYLRIRKAIIEAIDNGDDYLGCRPFCVKTKLSHSKVRRIFDALQEAGVFGEALKSKGHFIRMVNTDHITEAFEKIAENL